jgi:hypothetical protein
MAINNVINSKQTLDSASSPQFAGLNLSNLATYSVIVSDSASNVITDAALGYNSLGGPLLSLSTSTGADNAALLLSATGSAGSSYIAMNRGDTTGKCFINFETNSGGPGGDQWWLGLTNTGTHNFFILDAKAGTTPFSITQSTGVINIASLTASQAVVTDASKNLTSLGYGSSNTASTLVARDGSGNFSAGTITAALSGNATSATTATTATNANNVATTQVSAPASYYPLMVASSTNSNQAPDLATGLSYNPSTNIISTTGMNLSGLTASGLVATDSSKNLTSSVSSLSPTFTGLTLGGLTPGSMLFVGASSVISQNSGNLVWDTTNNNLYIGASTSTSLDVPGRLVIRGTASSVTNGSDVIWYNTADSHPLMQVLPFLHDNVGINFDAAYNGSNWVSSYSSSQFQIYKLASKLQFNYAAATQGSTFSWSTGIYLDTNGVFNTNQITLAIGKTLLLTTGSNACRGTATMAAGSASVTTTAALTGNMIIVTGPNANSYGTTITNATGFSITSSNVLDGSTVNWVIIK